MKYTRFEFKKDRDENFKHFAFRFLLLIPVIAIVCGMILSRYIIVPYILKLGSNQSATNIEPEVTKKPQDSSETEKSNKPADETYEYETLKPRKYYIAQAGYFSTLDNAESFLNLIKQANLPAYVNKEEQYFRVIVFLDSDKAKVNKRINDYKALGYTCFVREINISLKEMPESYRKDNKYILLNRMIIQYLKVIDENKDFLSKYENKSIDFNTLKEKLDDGNKSLSQLISKYNEITNKDDEKIDNFIEKYETTVNTVAEISKLKNDNTVIQKAYEKDMQSVYLLNELSIVYNEMF